MITWLLGTSTGRNLLAIGGALITALAIAGALISRGARNERLRTRDRTQRETIKAHEVRNEIERTVGRGGDVHERLRSDWTRP
jgi:hypothetical protein